MPKRSDTILRLPRALYDPRLVEAAATEFAEVAEIAVVRRGNHTEVAIAGTGDGTVPSEFANYALFLTIQSR